MSAFGVRASAWFDRLGVAVSGACALHCAAVPVAFALLPSLHLALFSLRDPQHRFALWLLALARYEAWLAGLALALAFATSVAAWRRRRVARGLAYTAAGAALLVAAFAVAAPRLHAAFAVAGGCALVLAHRANLRARD